MVDCKWLKGSGCEWATTKRFNVESEQQKCDIKQLEQKQLKTKPKTKDGDEHGYKKDFIWSVKWRRTQRAHQTLKRVKMTSLVQVCSLWEDVTAVVCWRLLCLLSFRLHGLRPDPGREGRQQLQRALRGGGCLQRQLSDFRSNGLLQQPGLPHGRHGPHDGGQRSVQTYSWAQCFYRDQQLPHASKSVWDCTEPVHGVSPAGVLYYLIWRS